MKQKKLEKGSIWEKTNLPTSVERKPEPLLIPVTAEATKAMPVPTAD